MAKKAISAGEYITTVEAARMLKKSPRAVRQYADNGDLPGVKINARTWLFERAVVRAFTPPPRGYPKGRPRPPKKGAAK